MKHSIYISQTFVAHAQPHGTFLSTHTLCLRVCVTGEGSPGNEVMYMYVPNHLHVHALLASFFLPSHLSFKNMYMKGICRHTKQSLPLS